MTNTASVTPPTGVTNPGTACATAGGSFSATTGACSASDSDTVIAPLLNLAKSHTGNFTVGTSGIYTLQVSNTGSAPTTGTITITDTLPTGLTFVTATGTGWTCAAAAQVVTCTSTTAIAAGSVATPTLGTPITLTVAVAAAAAPSVTNTARASGGGDTTCPAAPAATLARCTPSDPTTVVQSVINAAKTALTVTGPNAGGVYTASYTVTVTNSGSVAGTYGTLADAPAFPSNTTITGATWTTSGSGAPAGGSSTSAGPYTLASAATAIAAGVTHTYAVSITYSYTNNATPSVCAATPTPGSGLYNNITLPAGQEASTADNAACINPPLTAQVTLSKNSNGPWTVGQAGAQYTLATGNAGNGTTSGTITVVDTLPTGITPSFTSPLATNGWTCNASGQTVTCTSAAAIAAGAAGTSIVLPVNVTATAVTPVVNFAAISGGGDPDAVPTPGTTCTPANQCATNSTVINRAQLTMTKTASAASFTVGVAASYTLQVSNTGTGATTAASTVTDTIPTGLTIGTLPAGCTAAGQTVTCTVAAGLVGGASTSFVIPVTPTAAAAASVTNTATVSGGGDATCPANARCTSSVTTPVAGVADLTLTKTNGTTSVTAGGTTAYTIVLTNNGPSTANGTVVTDAATTGLTKTAVTCVAAGGAVCPAVTVANFESGVTVATLPSGGFLTFTVNANVTAASGSVTNSVTATLPAGTTDPTPTGTVSDTDTVAGSADLGVTKAVDNATPPVGSNVTFTVVVSNSGPSSADAVTVNDSLPAGYTYVSHTVTVGTYVPGTGVWTVGNLVAAGSATLQVTATVNAAGPYLNTATASSTTPDPVPGNNTATRTTTPTTTPVLTVVKTASAASFSVNVPASYTIQVTNSGTSATTAVATVTDAVPAGLLIGTLPAGCAATGQNLTCTIASGLAVSTSTSFVIPVTPQASIGGTTVSNTALVSGGGDAGCPAAVGRCSSTVGTPVVGVPAYDFCPIGISKPIFSLVNGARVSRYEPGAASDAFVPELDFNVAGDVNGMMVDPVRNRLLFVSRSGSNALLWAFDAANGGWYQATAPFAAPDFPRAGMSAAGVGYLIAGGSTNPQVWRVSAATAPGSFNYTVALLGNLSYDFAPSDLGSGDIAFDASGAGWISAGRDLYKLDVTTLQAVRQTQPLLNGAPATINWAGVAYANDGTLYLANNSSPSRYYGYNPATGVLTPAAPTTANASRDLASCAFPVQAVPQLSTVKSLAQVNGVAHVAGAPVKAGDTLTYAILISNTGGAAATLYPGEVVETLPANTTVVTAGNSFTCSGSNCPNTTATNVPANGSVTLNFVVQVVTPFPTGATASIVNAVTVKDVDCAASGNDCGETTSVALPALTLDKTTATTTYSAVGQVIPYSYVVTNSGNVAVTTAITVNDDRVVSPNTVACPALPAGGLLPTQSITCTANYTVTQADLNAGTVVNVATATDGTTTSPSDTVTVNATQAPALTLDKTTTATGYAAVGDVLAYSYLVTNSGNVTLTAAIIVNDDKIVSPNTVACPALPAGGLLPTQSITCTANYTVTQADLNAGTVVNVATATDGTITSPSDTVTVTATQAPSLTVNKTAGTPSGNTVGSTIAYSFLVTNTGNVTLTGIVINDALLDTAATCAATTLIPGATTTCTGTHTITQAEINAGTVNNSATASGTPPTGPAITSPPDTTVTPIASAPSLTVDKTAGTPSGNTAGSTIAYSFLVTNTGNVTLTGIVINDALLDVAATCAATTLIPGATTTCTGTHTITQAEVNAGTVNNSATASGTPPTGPAITSPPDTTVTPIALAPSLTVDKTAGTPSGNTAGSTIAYSFLVTNTGNVTLTGIVINDALLDAAASCAATTLLPGATTTCTGTHTITQAEVNAGTVNNSATASGTPPTGPAITSPPDTTVTPIASTPSLTIDKTAGTPSGNTAGSTIAYSFLVTNTGNVTLTGIVINDALLDAAAVCTSTTLIPGATTTCSGTHTITQAEVNAGTVNNSATATGTPPTGPAITSPPDTTVTPIASAPALTVDKTAGTPSGNTAGSTIAYSFLVTNTGNVTLTGILVNDALLDAAAVCTSTTLIPGATTTCTGTHTITQAEVNAGTVNNSATATGTPPGGGTTTSPPDTTVTPIASAPALTVDKTAGTPSGNTAGSTIAYSFLVTNTGNVTLTGIVINDALLDTTATCAATTLIPGATTTCTGTHTITQAEVNAGTVNNSATATGTPPTGPAITSPPDTTVTPIASAPALTVDKTAGTPSGNTAGSTIAYSFLVTNTGNVTLTGIVINDALLDAAATCAATTLIPGATTTCTGTHTITQAEVNLGTVNNSATATGTPPTGPAITSPPDTTVTPIASAPALTVDKTAGTPSGNTAGSTIAYSFLVTNTGNVTLTGIVINDALLDAAATCAATTLIPGATTTCTGTHTITQAEVNAGTVNNSATASGTPPTGPAITSPPDTTVTPIASAPALTVDKTAGTPSGNTAGSTIAYSFLVTNTGNVTLTGIIVNDALLDAAATCAATTLIPGASTTCAGTHTITQTEVNLGTVNNSATASGTPPTGPEITSPPDTTTTPIAQTPAQTLLKELTANADQDGSGSVTVGDTLTYTVTVTNTGNTTLANVVVGDPITTPASITCPSVAPGATCQLVGTYTVTAADVSAGEVSNTAVVTSPVCATGSSDPACTTRVDVPVTPATTSVSKSVDTAGPVQPGATLTYTLATVVTGSATSEAVTLTDTLGEGLSFGAVTAPGIYTCTGALVCTLPIGTLPGTYAVSYMATVDADATGTVSNTVVATTPPGGDPDPTCTNCTTDTPVTPSTSAVSKRVDTAGPVLPGATLTYTLTTVVTGSATSEAVTLTDTLGAGLSFGAVTTPGIYTCTGAVVCTLPIGTLPGTYEVSYTATVDADATGTVSNAVVATTPPGGDPDPTCTNCTTDTPVAASVVTVAKLSDPASGTVVAPGDTINYTLSVTVANAATTAAVTLTDTITGDQTLAAPLPAGCTSAASGLVCTLPAGSLPGTYTFAYATTVDADAIGNLANNVVPAGDDLPTCTSCSTQHDIAPTVVTFSKSSDPVSGTAVAIGDIIGYTLTVTVANSATTEAVVLDDSWADELTLVGALPAGCVSNGGGLVCTLAAGSLPGIYNFTYTAMVNANADGDVVNIVTASGGDVPTCSGTCTTSHPVLAPVVTVNKASTPASGISVAVGDTIGYTLTVIVANAATTAAVTLTDTLSGDQTLSGTLPAGCVASAGGLVCALPAGSEPGTYTFVYSATVDADATGNVGNVVVPSGGDNPTCGTACITDHPVVSDFELRVLKTASVREVKIGDLVRYSITVENVGTSNLVNGSVLDTPAAGFSYVEGSLTVRDGDNMGIATGQSPVRFDGIDVAAGETATLTYAMRVGAGVRPGVQVNEAVATTQGGQSISNVSRAEVILVADALVDESLLLGTVFDDRDGDAWQDSAALSGVRVQGGFAASAYVPNSTTVDRGAGAQPEADASSPMLHGIDVGAISPRQSSADPVANHRVVIRQRLSALSFTDDFVLTSNQGVSVRMDAAGNTRVEKSGEAAKGLNGAEPTVERRVAQGEGGYVVDYVISNLGIDERGIPGVRIASVEGLLIETDQFGRYHLEGISSGDISRGRNFILKVDPSTLPAGTVFTTDNPLVRRITPGLPVRFDFGVKLPVEEIKGGEQQVELELGEVVFAPGSAALRSEYLPVIAQIAARVVEYRGGEVLVSATGDSQALAFERASAVKDSLQQQVPAEFLPALTVSVRTLVDDPSSMVVGVAEGGPLLGTVLFDTDKATVKPQYLPMLDKIAAYLDKRGGGVVAVVGHADRRASDAYNIALGMRRAKAVYEAIAAKLNPEVRSKVRVEASNDPAAPAVNGK